MGKNFQHILLFIGLCAGLTLSSSSFGEADQKNSPDANAAQSGRSADFQRRLQAEQAAEDARDRNAKVQEQARLEEVELQKTRTERAAQRNAQRAADAAQKSAAANQNQK
jgi:hypothetical protein